MTFHAGPGKTAAKVYQDFLIFDPVKGRPSVLAETTPPYGEGRQLAPPIGSCTHNYVIKTNQSVPPPLDLRPRPDSPPIYKLAAVCKRCRIHTTIYLDSSAASDPCPSSEHPLHHFQRCTNYDVAGNEKIQYAWQCSVAACRSSLFIIYKKCRLDDEEIQLLSNPELLKRRYDAVIQDDPTREGIKLATSMEALSRLRRYIKDSLVPEHHKRSIPSNNKRFQEAYGMNGDDCAELLENLGFTYADNTWTLPNPEPIDDRIRADGHSLREQLEDVEMELLLWMHKLVSDYGMINPHASEVLSSADRDIERTLAAQGYPRYVTARRAISSNEVIPFFNSLGALPDFSDSLIEYAYDRQVSCDPELQTYYLECLQVITESRYSEQLHMKLAKLESQDLISRRDLSAAYRFLNISGWEIKSISDERIIEKYQAQQPDLSAQSQEQARTHLYKIGLSRNSPLLLSASRQSVDTYETALAWLGNGANKDTPDEGLLAVLSIKTGDNKANEEIGLKAIATIAKARKSNHLNSFLLTGRQDGYTMSVDEALRHLNIEEKLESIDQSILPAIFESALLDRPGETTQKAISTIQQAISGGGSTAHNPETWPVGLTSHGNTCYLNSLLQYYFSIKPLRDIVLDYDQYRLDVSQNGGKDGRVGQRMISMVEIEGGQAFAADLKHLFERMIKSRDSAVKPETDLVCRAFLEPKEYKLLGRIIDTDKNGKPGNATVNGGMEAIDDKPTDGETLTNPGPIAPPERKESNASSTTLQASVNGDGKDVAMKDAEMPPTPPGTPGIDGKEQAPPLPPRRFSTTKEEALAKAEANAKQQQDVTEVHDKISFLLRCGIKPRGWDQNGEQEDAFRDLFAVRMTQTAVNKGIEQKPLLLPDSAIQLNVPMEPTDIYSALDDVFDLQPYADNPAIETYKSIEALPPLLQINIPRIGYDATRSAGASFKSTECVSLKDELFLDRYCDASHENTLSKRRQCWGWRRQLQDLKREQNVLSKTSTDLDGPTAVAQTAEYLSSIDSINRDLEDVGVEAIEADGEITAALLADAEQQSKRLGVLESEIDKLQPLIDAQFEDMKNIKYRLAAVFFHRGSYGHGHYWIYIHDFENNVWRIYNDERVDEFKKLQSIFEAKTWDQGTPTYAVYVAEDKIDYVQTVFRDLEPAPPPATEAWTESGSNNAKPQQDSVTTVDPKLLTRPMVTESSNNTWDEDRQVVDMTGGGNMGCGERTGRPRLVINGPRPELWLEPNSKEEMMDVIEEVDNTNNLDHKLAYEMHHRYYSRGLSPPKRRSEDSGYTSGSPSKLQKTAAAGDLPTVPKLDLKESAEVEEAELLESIARAAKGCVDM